MGPVLSDRFFDLRSDLHFPAIEQEAVRERGEGDIRRGRWPMEVEEVDPVSGRKTTGHIWNGIKELDTPIPRGVLLFLIVTHIFAVLWWFLLPTWPLGKTYTK